MKEIFYLYLKNEKKRSFRFLISGDILYLFWKMNMRFCLGASLQVKFLQNKQGLGWSGCSPCGGGKGKEEEPTTGIKLYPFLYACILSPPEVDVTVIGKQELA